MRGTIRTQLTTQSLTDVLPDFDASIQLGASFFQGTLFGGGKEIQRKLPIVARP